MDRIRCGRHGRRPLAACIGLKFWTCRQPRLSRRTCAASNAFGLEGRVPVKPSQGARAGGAVRVIAAPRYDEHHQIIGAVELIYDTSEEIRVSNEINRLVSSAREGRLSERGNAGAFER